MSDTCVLMELLYNCRMCVGHGCQLLSCSVRTASLASIFAACMRLHAAAVEQVSRGSQSGLTNVPCLGFAQLLLIHREAFKPLGLSACTRKA